MKNQYLQPRTLPKPTATFPELPGSARELPGAAEILFGGLSSAQAPARAESGWPQNWSPVISGSPKPLKINEKTIFCPEPFQNLLHRPTSKLVPGDFQHRKLNEKSIFSTQDCSKTFCNLPRFLWKRHRASWSRPSSGRLSGAQAPARAETGRPQNWSPASFCVHVQCFF